MRDIRSYQNGNWNSVTQLPKDHSGLRAPSEHHFRVRRRGVFLLFTLSLSLMPDSIRPNCYQRVGTRVCAYRLILWWDVFHSEGGGWFQTRRETTHSCQYCKPTVETGFFFLFFFLFLFCSLIGSFLASLLHAFILWLKREAIYVHKESKRVLSLVATLVSYTFPMYMSLLSH